MARHFPPPVIRAFPRFVRRLVLIVFAAYTVAFALLIALRPFEGLARTALSDIGVALPALVAGAFILLAGLRSVGKSRVAWTTIGAGYVCWAAGEAVWSFYSVALQRETPFPSPADAFYLVGYPLIFVGFVVLASPSNWRLWLRNGLDAMAVVAIALTFAWEHVVQPVLQDSEAVVLERVLAAAYPIGDLVLLFALVLALPAHRTTRSGRVLLLMTSGLAVTLAADLIFGYLSLQEAWSSGELVNIAWVGGYFFFAAAAHLQIEWLPDYREEDRQPTGWQQALPLALTPFLAGWLLFHSTPVQTEALPSLVFAVGAMCMVVARQTLSFLDALAVNRELANAYVELSLANRLLEERARDLEQTLASEQERSNRDVTTGALSRRAIEEVLRKLLLQARVSRGKLMVGLVDVDSLKGINDQQGHLAGDAALSLTAAALRAGDALVGRYGGDEFLVVLPGADKDEAEAYLQAVRQRLRRASRSRFPAGVDISAGFAAYPAEGEGAEALVGLADSRMYAEKSARRATPNLHSVA